MRGDPPIGESAAANGAPAPAFQRWSLLWFWHHLLVGAFEVVVGAGTLGSTSADAVRFPHRWTDEGVTVDAAFTGAHLLHLAAAGCVLNDVYREALARNVAVKGVRVTASGGFDTDTWQSNGIGYVVEIDTDSPAEDVDVVLEAVDATAEIPKSIRAGATVERLDRRR